MVRVPDRRDDRQGFSHVNDTQDIIGTVWAVSGHRFAVGGRVGGQVGGRERSFPDDLGPDGAQGIDLEVGDTVSLKGARRSAEIEVASLTLTDGTVRTIDWAGKPPHPDGDAHAKADPAVAVAAVRAEGYAVAGEPARKRKHVEIVGAKDGARYAIHVGRDGGSIEAKPLVA